MQEGPGRDRWMLTFPIPSPQKLLLGLTYFGGPLPCSSWASRFLQVCTEVPTPTPLSTQACLWMSPSGRPSPPTLHTLAQHHLC